MKKNDFLYVLTIAEYRSFSRAAENLYISQPALSRYISALEADLNVVLFDRSVSPLKLTAEGNIFCSYAKDILRLENELCDALKNHDTSNSKPIRIVVPPVSGDYLILRFYQRLNKSYHAFSIRPCVSYSSLMHSYLSNSQADVAISFETTNDPSCMVRTIAHEPVYLVGNKDLPEFSEFFSKSKDLFDPVPISPFVLNKIDIPLLVFDNSYAELAFRQLLYNPKSIIKVSSPNLALRLAAEGAGLTCVIRSQLKYESPIITSTLRTISIEECTLPLFCICKTSSYQTNANLRILIEEITNELTTGL